MQILTLKDAEVVVRSWRPAGLEAPGETIDVRESLSPTLFAAELSARGEDSIQFWLDPDSGRKTALANLLASYAFGNEACASLAFVFDEDVFASDVSDRLFALFRQGLGEHRGLIDAPCQYFQSDEAGLLACVLALVQYFIWSVLVVRSDGTLLLIDHDEWLSIWSSEPEIISAAQDALSDFRLVPKK
jgi:hypothetical protein